MMTRNRIELLVGASLTALAVLFTAVAVVLAATRPQPQTSVEIVIHYSHFQPSAVTVPAGVPVTFTIRNDDPIDHEWIVGDADVQQRHRVGTEVVHNSLPTEQMIPAGQTVVTTITFPAPGALQYICHLPGHEAYGMVGLVTIVQ